MSIASEIQRLQQAKADIKTAIENKGVTIPSSYKIQNYARYIDDYLERKEVVVIEKVNVTNTSIPTVLFFLDSGSGSGSGSGSDEPYYPFYKMEVDGITVGVSNSYRFTRTGEHTVKLTANPEDDGIGSNCFYNCSAITSIFLSEGIRYIEDSAFYNCTNLSSITFPNSLKTINYDAFEYCYNLRSVIIPSGVTEIMGDAFNGCSQLTSITVAASTPPTVFNSTFKNTNNCPIYVPSDKVNVYKTNSWWSSYASRIQAI